MQRLAEKLYKLMLEKGLNQQRLAERAELSDSEVSRILRGQSKKPALDNAFRLARAVGVSLDYLADDSLDEDPGTGPEPLQPKEREILDRARKLGEQNVAMMLDVALVLGYEVAIRRLYGLEMKPIVEVEDRSKVTIERS